MARPEEIASVMVFLLSDEASYLTGALVPVDGGLLAGFRSSDWEVADLAGARPIRRRGRRPAKSGCQVDPEP